MVPVLGDNCWHTGIGIDANIYSERVGRIYLSFPFDRRIAERLIDLAQTFENQHGFIIPFPFRSCDLKMLYTATSRK